MLRSVTDFRTLGALLRVNRTFYRAYEGESTALLRATARKEYGDLLGPMLAITESILGENAILPSQRRHAAQPRSAIAFDSLLIKTLLEVDSVLDAWLRIYEYRGPLALLNYREMSFTSPSVVGAHAHTCIGSTSASPARESAFGSSTFFSRIGPIPFFIDPSSNTGAFAAVHNSPARWEPLITCQMSSFFTSNPCTTSCTPSSHPYLPTFVSRYT